jgi:hypothetical protein
LGSWRGSAIISDYHIGRAHDHIIEVCIRRAHDHIIEAVAVHVPCARHGIADIVIRSSTLWVGLIGRCRIEGVGLIHIRNI